MKKFTVLALLVTFVVAGSAFAAPTKAVAPASVYFTGAPATTDNDDSCDISVMPAATLLLPYFEVAQDPNGETTTFTITNVSEVEQIAHVVLWTDYSYPVIDFNIYLTGYDVQSINLNDVIWRGIIAPASGAKTAVGTGIRISPGATTVAPYASLTNAQKAAVYVNEYNPIITDRSRCATLPGNLPTFYQQRMQSAFTEGTVAAVPNTNFSACNYVGNEHVNAVGYATIDVARACSTGLPTDGATYFSTEIAFDNVLIGDYNQINRTQNYAQANPMVHIRAIPEGEQPELPINFDRTFYSRYQAGGVADRRQPLPSTFAARWIDGGTGSFGTSFKIWREGTYNSLSCYNTKTGDLNIVENGFIGVQETVVFDEDENGLGISSDDIIISPAIGQDDISLPETSLTSITDEDVFPQGTLDATGGWVYLDLDNAALDIDGENLIASQNWVVVSMRAEGRFSADFDAAALGNGCTPPAELSYFSEIGGVEGEEPIGPAPNNNPDPDFVLD